MSFLHRLKHIIRRAAKIAREIMDEDVPTTADALDADLENDFAWPMSPFSCVVVPVRATCPHRSYTMWAMTSPEGDLVGFVETHEEGIRIVSEMLLAELRADVLPDEMET